MAALKTSIEPVYIRDAPSQDAWGNSLIVSAAITGYTIGSGGKDGAPLNFIGSQTSNFNDAMIYINGQFVQWPEGSQQ